VETFLQKIIDEMLDPAIPFAARSVSENEEE
jgi:hypothetical protein